MSIIEKQREKLLKKLKELFQLDQPDLDFGFYRIMQSRKEQITYFIDKELLSYIREAFSEVDASQIAALQAEVEREIQTAKEYGATDPENAPRVLDAKIRLKQAKDTSNIEAEIYDHLFRFFERYYEDGDFISRRYYSRETDKRAAAYAIPYSGEEVSLHWANKDQYYVKSSDYFTNYRFNLSEAFKKHLPDNGKAQSEIELEDISLPENLYVSFVITDASEGDHGNIKSSESDKRFFIIRKENPLKLISPTELEIYFEYRSDPAKGSTQENTWREEKIKEAIEIITQNLQTDPAAASFLKGFSLVLPTESNKSRSLLEKYLQQYTSRNTRDYFIHKDLGSFLKRELDFYIKNEIMHLDDIENADAPRVEEYLTKIKVIRKIAGKLIKFLAQLEDFQKKLWLKKKFVVQADYCLTLDRIPKALYSAICNNEAQISEWIKLYAIDEIKGDAVSKGFSQPLTLDFLKENPYLVLDTRFFDPSFKEELLSSIDNLDEQCDGLLIHSENFQALNLLQERYREQVKCIYIDPPYNTAATEIIYKNSYKHSSWLSLIHDRILNSIGLGNKNSFFVTAIDHAELHYLGLLKNDIFGEDNRIAVVAVQHNPKGRNQAKFFSENSDYMLVYSFDIENATFNDVAIDEDVLRSFTEQDENGRYRYENFLRARTSWSKNNRPLNWYPIYVSPDLSIITDEFMEGFYEIYPTTNTGDFSWKNIKPTFIELNKGGYFKAEMVDNRINIFHKYREKQVLKNVWIDKKYQSEFNGTNLLKDVLGTGLFDYPKSLYTIVDICKIMADYDGYILDYFAGSGTTAHAVINLNREDGGTRKYILVEMGDYFDTVLKPRIQKVIYSDSWKDGKPVNRDSGISHCFKYLRLESYEDTLNNLELVSSEEREATLASNRQFKEDYLLNYFLEVESRESLLNTDAFMEPDRYQMKIKKAGSDEQHWQNIDLLETFNYLIGLRIEHIDKRRWLDASFRQEPDPELPDSDIKRLVLDGALKEVEKGKWWVRKLEGWIPQNPFDPNNGLKEKVLIVWRNLSGDLEKDNLVLESWFQKNRISTLDREFDAIYVNGSSSLPNLLKEGENWKVRLIEEEFLKAMWSEQGE